MQCQNVSNEAIKTRYIGATNTKPTRIIAQWSNYKLTMSYDYEFNTRENHILAANKLIEKFGIFGLFREQFQLITAWSNHDMVHIPIIAQD